MSRTLEQCRQEIDRIDRLIIDAIAILIDDKNVVADVALLRSFPAINDLLDERAEVVKEVASYKAYNNMDVFDSGRESSHTIALIKYSADKGIPPATTKDVMQVIYVDSRNAQEAILNRKTDKQPPQMPPTR